MLLELVAIERIVGVPGVIVEQVHLVFDQIRIGLPRSVVGGLRYPPRQREAAGVAAVGRVERAVKADLSRRHGPLRDLIGGVPGVGIGHPGQRIAVGRGALRVARKAAEFFHIVGIGPWTVVAVQFAGIEQRAAAELARAERQISVVAEAADGDRLDVLLNTVAQIDGKRAGIGEVSHVGEVRPFADIHATDCFRNEEVEIGVALPMGMGRQIDRHVVDERGHVGAVVEIVAAQVILIGLAAVGMLDRDEAGRRFDDLAGTRDRTRVKVRAGDRHLTRQLRHDRRAARHVGRAGPVGRGRRGCRSRGLRRSTLRRVGTRPRRRLTFRRDRDGRKLRTARLFWHGSCRAGRRRRLTRRR